jgi:hypothetical protein
MHRRTAISVALAAFSALGLGMGMIGPGGSQPPNRSEVRTEPGESACLVGVGASPDESDGTETADQPEPPKPGDPVEVPEPSEEPGEFEVEGCPDAPDRTGAPGAGSGAETLTRERSDPTAADGDGSGEPGSISVVRGAGFLGVASGGTGQSGTATGTGAGPGQQGSTVGVPTDATSGPITAAPVISGQGSTLSGGVAAGARGTTGADKTSWSLLAPLGVVGLMMLTPWLMLTPWAVSRRRRVNSLDADPR